MARPHYDIAALTSFRTYLAVRLCVDGSEPDRVSRRMLNDPNLPVSFPHIGAFNDYLDGVGITEHASRVAAQSIFYNYRNACRRHGVTPSAVADATTNV
jgi:hypothetical protein